MRRKRTKPTPNTRAIAGIRVSTDDQSARQGPDRQRREIIDLALEQKLSIDRWIEESVSGADHDRAAENQYYEAVRSSPGLNVIFSTADRVGRYIEVTVGIARQIHDLGGTVWIAGIGNLRLGRNWDYFKRDALDAESDYTRTVSRLHDGKLDKARRGHWPHGRPPYGYYPLRDVRGISTTLELTSSVVSAQLHSLFESALEHGLYSLVDIAAARGIPNPSGGETWNSGSMLHLLKNETYAGSYHFGDEIVNVPAIVSPELFEAVQNALRTRHSGPKAKYDALLCKHLECAYCGSTLTYTRSVQGGKVYSYYICRFGQPSRARREGKELCSLPRFSAPPLEQTVWAYLLEHLPDAGWLEREYGQKTPETPDYSSEKLLIRDRLRRIGNALVSGLFEEGEAQSQAAPLKLELGRLEALERGPVSSHAPDWVTLAARLGVALEHAGTMPLEQRAVLKLFGVRVWVGREGIVRVALEGVI